MTIRSPLASRHFLLRALICSLCLLDPFMDNPSDIDILAMLMQYAIRIPLKARGISISSFELLPYLVRPGLVIDDDGIFESLVLIARRNLQLPIVNPHYETSIPRSSIESGRWGGKQGFAIQVYVDQVNLTDSNTTQRIPLDKTTRRRYSFRSRIKSGSVLLRSPSFVLYTFSKLM